MVFQGIPQGSVLDPLLFSFYITNPAEQRVDVKPHTYADDTPLYKTTAKTTDLVPAKLTTAVYQRMIIGSVSHV